MVRALCFPLPMCAIYAISYIMPQAIMSSI
jgi:hypothetical protein